MEDLISIGTVGLIKAVSTYNLEKGSRLGTYAARCIENELLMYFRSKKKTARDVSLYEPIGTDKEGNQIKLLDIVESGEPELWERVVEKKNILRLYELVSKVLDERENWIIRRRYGLYNTKPVTQREIANSLGIWAAVCFTAWEHRQIKSWGWKNCGRRFYHRQIPVDMLE